MSKTKGALKKFRLFNKTSSKIHAIRSRRQIVEEFDNTLKSLLSNTTIGGLRRIFGHRALSRFYRFLWSLMWLSIICCCWVLCRRAVNKYLAYEIRTSFRYDRQNQFEFPAITVCNSNWIRRSSAGGSFKAMIALATQISDRKSRIQQIAFENNRTCQYSPPSDMAKLFEQEGVNMFLRLGLRKAMHSTALDSTRAVLKCWWNDRLENCQDWFFNHATDLNWCFTFNPNKRFLYSSAEVNDTYEPTRERHIQRLVYGSGPKIGLKLLLNASKEDYCGANTKYFMNLGFVFKPHDPDVQPLLAFGGAVKLAPNFAYSIALRPKRIHRKTEHLGRCVSAMRSLVYPNLTYFREMCIFEGYVKLIWKRCSCYAILFDGLQTGMANLLNVPLKNLTLCWNEKAFCAKAAHEFVLNSDVEALFPECKPGCSYTDYEVQSSRQGFPAVSAISSLAREFGVDNVSRLERNLIVANFYFDSMTSLTIRETQKYPLINVFRDFGAVLSLFLGMSVISLGEITHIITLLIHYTAKLVCILIRKIKVH